MACVLSYAGTGNCKFGLICKQRAKTKYMSIVTILANTLSGLSNYYYGISRNSLGESILGKLLLE